jgi:hypothetical protein
VRIPVSPDRNVCQHHARLLLQHQHLDGQSIRDLLAEREQQFFPDHFGNTEFHTAIGTGIQRV